MSDKMMRDINCSIAKDLLPLYHDEILSETGRQAVEAHLKNCEVCRREYEELCSNLPLKTSVTTKDKFIRMARKWRLHERMKLLVVFGILLVFLRLLYIFLTEVPLVRIDAEEVIVHGVYRTIDENGATKFLYFYSTPGGYQRSSIRYTIEKYDGKNVYVIDHKVPLIRKYDSMFYSSDQDGIVTNQESISGLRIGKQLAWLEEIQGNEPIPEFVYEFGNRFEPGGWPEYQTINHYTIQMDYDDGRRVIWDVDGTLLYEAYPDENGNYPEHDYYLWINN